MELFLDSHLTVLHSADTVLRQTGTRLFHVLEDSWGDTVVRLGLGRAN